MPDGPVVAPTSEPLTITHESEETSSTLVINYNEEVGRKIVDNGDSSGENEVNVSEEDQEETREREEMMKRPFFRRPSPWWILGTILFSSIAMSTTIAPKVELYTALACRAMKPEYTVKDSVNTQHWDMSGGIPPPSKMCAKDAEVQAAVARLITMITVPPGILSCLTTGWWGQVSDRYGRTWILGIATIGILVTDFNFILVSLAADRLPGGYRFLLVGPTIDGLFGGMTTHSACLYAYISDCTPTEERSRIFSLNTGLLFLGMAFGPALGGILIQATNNLLSVFYLAATLHILSGFFIWFILPESLPKSSMRKARKRRETERSENEAATSQQNGLAIRAWILAKYFFAFLAPLSLFIPSKRLEGRGRDWNLLLMVFSYASHTLLMESGSYPFKFQYAQRAFGWGSEALGYFISVFSVTRVMFLVLVLPLIIKFFKPKPPPIQLPSSPEEPLHVAPELNHSSIQQPTYRHPASFDLNLARVSLVIEFLCSVGIILAVSPAAWTAFTVLTALGGGFAPAMQSISLALYEQGPLKGAETGRLFGGLSVVNVLCSQIIGPALYGLTYISTVKTFPKGIFVVSAGMVASSLFFMSVVRLLRGPPNEGHDREETVVA